MRNFADFKAEIYRMENQLSQEPLFVKMNGSFLKSIVGPEVIFQFSQDGYTKLNGINVVLDENVQDFELVPPTKEQVINFLKVQMSIENSKANEHLMNAAKLKDKIRDLGDIMDKCAVCKGEGFYIIEKGYEVLCTSCDGKGEDKED